MENKQPKTLQQAIQIFADETVCINTVAAERWPDGKPECPKCSHKEHYWLATQKRWKCKACGKQFSVKVGTIMEDSALPLSAWLPAMWMLANCRNGVSSYELARALGITQKSAWFMLHRIRESMRESDGGKFGGPGREVESDEAYIGGKLKNMHGKKRQAMKITAEASLYGDTRLLNKSAVIGILDRETRRIRTTVVPAVNRKTMQDSVLAHLHTGTRLYTDEATIYKGLPKQFVHEFVNHLETYVRGAVHTNGMENYWSLVKRGLNGTYIAVEPFHVFRYLDEQAFRFNNHKIGRRKLTDGERFQLLMGQLAGKRTV